MKLPRLNRTIHKWASIFIALPLIFIIVTGILLLIRKEFDYLQPPSQRGINHVPSISFEQILAQVKTVPEADITSWDSIALLDVRPNKGIIKVRSTSNWEIQLDASTGAILQTAFRRSNIIESLHDATYFQKYANLWFTLPISIMLLIISITGIVLFFLPYYLRAKKRKDSA